MKKNVLTLIEFGSETCAFWILLFFYTASKTLFWDGRTVDTACRKYNWPLSPCMVGLVFLFFHLKPIKICPCASLQNEFHISKNHLFVFFPLLVWLFNHLCYLWLHFMNNMFFMLFVWGHIKKYHHLSNPLMNTSG